MGVSANALRWSGQAGHYEVYYLSATDARSGWGVWIRYTMLAPRAQTDQPPSASLWLMAMHPDRPEPVARKVDFPIDRLRASDDPFELRIGDALLTDHGMSGAAADAAWDLHWRPGLGAYHHVHPTLERAGVAQTNLVLVHPDLEVTGSLRIGELELELEGARGGQAHLWGTKHARRWAWAHCNALSGLDGEPRPECFVDGVSVFVSRLGREVGPSTPVVGRVLGDDFHSTSPVRVMRNPSGFGLTSWHFDARDGHRRLVGRVDAPRHTLVGVTYHDPDGELAHCYNSEVASMRVWVYDRVSRRARWALRDTLQARSCAHFEYAQREPLPGLALALR